MQVGQSHFLDVIAGGPVADHDGVGRPVGHVLKSGRDIGNQIHIRVRQDGSDVIQGRIAFDSHDPHSLKILQGQWPLKIVLGDDNRRQFDIGLRKKHELVSLRGLGGFEPDVDIPLAGLGNDLAPTLQVLDFEFGRNEFFD